MGVPKICEICECDLAGERLLNSWELGPFDDGSFVNFFKLAVSEFSIFLASLLACFLGILLLLRMFYAVLSCFSSSFILAVFCFIKLAIPFWILINATCLFGSPPFWRFKAYNLCKGFWDGSVLLTSFDSVAKCEKRPLKGLIFLAPPGWLVIVSLFMLVKLLTYLLKEISVPKKFWFVFWSMSPASLSTTGDWIGFIGDVGAALVGLLSISL